MSCLAVRNLARISYRKGLRIQQETWRQRLAGEIDDTLLLLEHDSVFTMGRRDSLHNMLLPERMLGAPVVHCDRGGEMTYHGPGQLLGYFHAKLSELDNGQGIRAGIGIKEFIYRMEEALILLLREHYGLEPWRDREHRGVWLGNDKDIRKIAALGISIKQGVSMHGFALNVSTDLSFFQQILPCGISGRGVTSLERELSAANLALPEVAKQLLKYFCSAFDYVDFHV